MAKSTFESRLTNYKVHHDYKHFGEALLNAAGEGGIVPYEINGESTQELLWQLGVAMRMDRDQVTRTLCNCEIDGRHPRGIKKQISRMIDSAICYTEQDMPERNSIEIAEVFA